MGNFISRFFKGHRTRIGEIKSAEEKLYASALHDRDSRGTIDVDA